jgi:hypothetical protein
MRDDRAQADHFGSHERLLPELPAEKATLASGDGSQAAKKSHAFERLHEEACRRRQIAKTFGELGRVTEQDDGDTRTQPTRRARKDFTFANRLPRAEDDGGDGLGRDKAREHGPPLGQMFDMMLVRSEQALQQLRADFVVFE